MLISFEGPDTSGKSTQLRLIAKLLEELGYKVMLIHFPNYESKIGSYIRQLITTKAIKEIDKVALQYLYIADQINQMNLIEQYINNKYIVLLDRYDLSTIVYSIANIDYLFINELESKRHSLASRIYDSQIMLRKPDLTFIFDITVDTIYKRKNVLDEFEKNTDLMKNICYIYSHIEDYISHDRKIIHLDAEKTIEAISENILNEIKGMI